MLQEILLSLSGVESPVWEALKAQSDTDNGIESHVSPSERAMLTRLAYLSQIHIEVKNQTNILSTKHPSLVCRAVSSAIAQRHLTAFGKRIVEVESSILQGEASHVGDYQIVPLSTLVADFEPWVRRIEWLRQVTQFMKGVKTKESLSNCTAAVVMHFLDAERQTGFTDLEDFATYLLIVAQTTWMRSLTSWILYGQLPSVGRQDFMVQKTTKGDSYDRYILAKDLTPRFISPDAAGNILAIGTGVSQMKMPNSSMQSKISQDTATSLMRAHLMKIKMLQYPLVSSLFESTMDSINASISRNALSAVLPAAEVIELCRTFKEYMLLGRGEFAVSLIETSDARTNSRGKSHSMSWPVRKLGRVEEMDFRDIELDSILSKTWADLTAVQVEDEGAANLLSRAKLYLRLRSISVTEPSSGNLPLTTLLPIPTMLQIDLHSNSSLRMFLSPSDAWLYSKICAYLLSLRRSQLRISSLWLLTSQRRCHPTPIGPPLSATDFGRRACESRRKRENVRSVRMRRFWSSASKALFVLSELNSYIHGEVIGNSWRQFEMWLKDEDQQRQQRFSSEMDDHMEASDRPRGEEAMAASYLTTSIPGNHKSRKDPRALARAHSAYLTALGSALLFEDIAYITTLTVLLGVIDHLVALLGRLSGVWQGLDLQEDDGVLDAFTNLAQDEKTIMIEMNRTRDELEQLLEQLVRNIKDAEKTKSQNELSSAVASVRIAHDEQGNFIPWRIRTLDRLIMKLNFMSSKTDDGDDIVDDLEYD